jgi:phosphoglycolate phosphatase
MAVLTNKPVGPARAICEGLGLSPYFFRIYGGNSFATKKPDPLGLRTLMEEAGATPEETLMIGDSDIDIRTARNAGAWALGCSYGLAAESLEEVQPDAVVDRASAWTLAVGGAEIRM